MTREEEITNATIDFKHEELPEGAGLTYAFFRGAEWADQHPHWISVEDELPPSLFEGGDMVIVTNGWHTWFSDYNPDKEDYGGWMVFNSLDRKLKVTHWMPLPQAPKKGGER